MSFQYALIPRSIQQTMNRVMRPSSSFLLPGNQSIAYLLVQLEEAQRLSARWLNGDWDDLNCAKSSANVVNLVVQQGPEAKRREPQMQNVSEMNWNHAQEQKKNTDSICNRVVLGKEK